VPRFLAGTDDDPSTLKRRNGAFKLIPHIVKGSWVVKQAVGETPVLLGNKLTTKYFRCLHRRSQRMQICRIWLAEEGSPSLFGSHAYELMAGLQQGVGRRTLNPVIGRRSSGGGGSMGGSAASSRNTAAVVRCTEPSLKP
jgi:Protein ENHANCED DISEASE RESISTANCE 2, C-terminal